MNSPCPSTDPAEPTPGIGGRLIGASLGPGDPGLITRAAWSALGSAPCWAWPTDRDGSSYALSIAECAGLAPPADRLPLHFPMTRDPETLALAWGAAAAQVAERLQAGTDVVFLVEGDASTYSTFGHLARAVRSLAPGIVVEVIPGVTSFNAAAAAAGEALADGEEALAVYSAPQAMTDLDGLLARFDALILLKVRPVLDGLVDALAARGVLDSAVFVERVGTPEERIVRNLAALRGQRVHYLSLVLIRRERRRGLGQGVRERTGPEPHVSAAPSEGDPERSGIVLFAVTRGGVRLACRLAEHLPDVAEILVPRRLLPPREDPGHRHLHGYDGSLAERIDTPFRIRRALVFVTSVGAAARLAAPHLRDKRSDPAVLAIDETGRFVVPLLGGHVGGANALACQMAEILGATPVVTTASDRQGTIAVDILGRELGWTVDADPQTLRRAAACVVNGEPVTVIEEACGGEWWPADRPLPPNLRRVPRAELAGAACAYLWVTRDGADPESRARLGDCVVVYRPPGPKT